MRREPVSIVCVANDETVRARCLDASIAAGLAEAPATEYLPIDNRGNRFASAGEALNHGARQARHDYLVFVHQDVHLHSLAALERAAGQLADRPELGMHGAIGIAPDGQLVGRVRDRFPLIGREVSAPTLVDSLDEVLFMLRRDAVLADPLSEEPELAWHAYAVEYGLRLRARGQMVTAGAIPLTHNSMTVNLDRLDVAHRAVADRHPEVLPVQTTCGPLAPSAPERRVLLADHRWRIAWLSESLRAQRVRAGLGGPGAVVLVDPRPDLDAALARVDGPVDVLNLVAEPAGAYSAPLTAVRGQRELSVVAADAAAVAEAVSGLDGGRSLVVTNLDGDAVRRFARLLPVGVPRLAGYHLHTDWWLLAGPGDRHVPPSWRTRRATPFAQRITSADPAARRTA